MTERPMYCTIWVIQLDFSSSSLNSIENRSFSFRSKRQNYSLYQQNSLSKYLKTNVLSLAYCVNKGKGFKEEVSTKVPNIDLSE